jgi:hypothetical protein
MSNEANVARGEITKEVIDTLVMLMADVIGQNAVDIVLRQSGQNGQPAGKDLVFKFAEETEKLLGSSGGYAILRQVGRDLAKKVASTRPKEQWQEALQQSLNDFGFADRIEKCDDHSSICNCVFYPILEERQLTPTKHAVCWAGWGFIEGFMKLMEGIQGIKFIERDMERKACKFYYLK